MARAEATTDATTTLYLRGMPVGLVREAKAAAARRGCTVARFVADALQNALSTTGEAAAADGGADELAESMAWYERNRARLVRKYAGAYIAVWNGAVIDHDTDFEALAGRVFDRVGVRPVFLPRVEPEDRVVRVRWPRRAAP